MLDIIKAIPQSFFSRQFYHNLNRRWSGVGFGLIVVMSLLQFACFMVSLVEPGMQILDIIPQITASLPVTTFANHKLSIDQPSPYYIRIPLKAEAREEADIAPALIDTNYEITDLTAVENWMKDNKIIALITAKQTVISEHRGRDLKVYSYGSIPDNVVTKEDWEDWGEKINFWLPLITIPSIAFGILISIVIKVFIGALLLIIIGFMTNSMQGFGAKMRIAAAATVPPTLLFLLIPHYGWVKFLLWLAYLIFGAMAARLSPRDQLLVDH